MRARYAKKILNPEIALGFLIATVLWAGALGWQASHAPTDSEKRQCEESAAKSGHKTEECKTLWERTTSDPVAFFTFWLVVSTIGLGGSTILLWLAGEKQLRHARRSAAIQSRDMRDSIAVANRSAATSERALAELERPWIFVFNAVCNETGGEFFVEYTVANYGKMPAIVDTAAIGFVFSDASGDPQAPIYLSEDHDLIAAPIMKSGEERKFREYFPTTQKKVRTYRVINEGTPEESIEAIPAVDLSDRIDLFFRAEVSYRGPTSLGHETGTNWLYRDPFDFVARGEKYNYTR